MVAEQLSNPQLWVSSTWYRSRERLATAVATRRVPVWVKIVIVNVVVLYCIVKNAQRILQSYGYLLYAGVQRTSKFRTRSPTLPHSPALSHSVAGAHPHSSGGGAGAPLHPASPQTERQADTDTEGGREGGRDRERERESTERQA